MTDDDLFLSGVPDSTDLAVTPSTTPVVRGGRLAPGDTVHQDAAAVRAVLRSAEGERR